MKRRQCLAFLGIALANVLLGLGLQLVTPEPAQAKSSLLISAAASLKDVLQEIKPLYQKKNSSVNLTFNFGASGALLQQIVQGAPVDVFISAGKSQMDSLNQKGELLPGTLTNLANNRLVLITPKGSKSVARFASLKQPEVKRISIGEPRSVPAGQYAEQVLRKLNLWDALKPKLVYGNNVRQVLAAVESGNADAGFVYITDARISENVNVVATADESSHSPIVYPMAVLKNSKNANVAKSFVQYLASRESKNTLRKYGFIVQ
jgi:molybdate transport system substrate-binding protein